MNKTDMSINEKQLDENINKYKKKMMEEEMDDFIKDLEDEERQKEIAEQECFERGNIYNIKKTPFDSINPITSSELANKEIPKKRTFLSPWFKEKEIAMVYAPPGTGKTFFA